MKVRFLDAPLEQDQQLAAWALERDLLCEAVFYAQSHYNDCTAYDQRGFDLIMAYDRVGRRLRERFIPLGWELDEHNNQVAIRHEYLKLRLYGCNFCSLTANPIHSPTNLSEKGSAARDNARSNAAQLRLFDSPEMIPNAAQEVGPGGYTTLILGMNFEGDWPKAEVSLPVRFGGGRYKGFSIRVPLLDGSIPPSNTTELHDSNDVFGEVDIPIRVKV